MTGTTNNPLLRRHRAIAAWCFVLVAAIYFVMSYPLSLVVRHLEARMSYGL